MRDVYVLGAGFSRTCGIATDAEMLTTLNARLQRTESEKDGTTRTTIDYLLEQNFRHAKNVGFEEFMSNFPAWKFASDCIAPGRNIFREQERELRNALRKYLTKEVSSLDWDLDGGKAILDFLRRVDWNNDFVLTFNYDRLLEAAAKHAGRNIDDRIIHLHGAIGERSLAWPTYTKFAYRTTKIPLAPRWQRAFEILRDHRKLKSLFFIGYSMPPSDLESRALFNYSDWYNADVTTDKSYKIFVINPGNVVGNYAFLRNTPRFMKHTLADWLRAS